MIPPYRFLASVLASFGPIVFLPPAGPPAEPREPRTFYVRQTTGDDANDGRSPGTAWRTLSSLEEAMHAGDTVYVGRGLYRETITVAHSGTEERRITFVADTTGEHTGDPPGIVMIAGADPVDETMFVASSAPGVYEAAIPDGAVLGVVEMDGPQYRYEYVYERALREGVPEREVVARLPSSFSWDAETETVTVHTSDGKPPTAHEIELIRRRYGIAMFEKHHITVIGFTFRHMSVSGVNFEGGTRHGMALGNTSYGSWQGIRVIHASTDVLVAGNTLLRNSNSGIYFANESARGSAVGNVAYENAKGIRWSKESDNGIAVDNVVFANREYGIAIEHTDGIRLVGNVLVDNAVSQLRSRLSRYTSDGNCFQNGGPDQAVASIDFLTRYGTLAAYREATLQEPGSREGCGPLPGRMDVHRLHAETTAYVEGEVTGSLGDE